MVLLLVIALSMAGHLVVGSFDSFLVVASVYRLSDRTASTVRGAVIGRAVPADQQVGVRGYLRALSNTGIAVGTLLAGWALHAGTAGAFRALILVSCGICLLAVPAALMLPPVPPVPRAQATRIRDALRDRRYLGFAAVNAVLSFQFAVLSVGVPLWVAHLAQVPRWLITVLFLVNTVLVATLQVRIGRLADTVRSARRATVAAALVLAGACALFGLAVRLPATAAAAVLVTAGVLHALGEILQVSAAWSLSFDLAPPQAHGLYQGLFTTSTSSGQMVGVTVVTVLAVDGGTPGWLGLGTIFALAGPAMLLATRTR